MILICFYIDAEQQSMCVSGRDEESVCISAGGSLI